MRRLLAISLLIAPAAAQAARVAGPEIPAPRSIPTPERRVVLPPTIASAKLTPAKGVLGAPSAYVDGPISLDVEIENPPHAPLSTELVVFDEVGESAREIARVPIQLPAGGTATVTYVAPGLRDGCSPLRHLLTLSNGNVGRQLVVTPSCTFGAIGEDPTERTRAREGKLTYHSAKITPAAPSCGGPLGATVHVKNGTANAIERGALVLEGPGTSETAFFDLAAGKETVVTVSAPRFHGIGGTYAIRLRAPEGWTSLVHQPGFAVRVTRSCRLDVALAR